VSESVDNKTVQRTVVKRQVAGTVQDLKREYKELVQKMKPHVYTILNQYAVLSAKKEKLQQHEVLIHIDFSENWTIKHLSAVQSAHFGASLQQVTLHTGVAYFQNNQTISFCSITDNSNHGPTAVWSHLIPVLINIRQNFDQVDTLHIVSDGPTTQYRNRYNFYLASVIPSLLGFQKTWWNFSKDGHEKGPADGVGAAVERLADRCVLAGMDLPDASALYTALKPLTTIQLFLVDQFISLSDSLNIPPLPGTMQVHQLLAEPSGQIQYRRWSCCCCQRTMCSCIKSKKIYVGDIDKSGIHIPVGCFTTVTDHVTEEANNFTAIQYFMLTDDGMLLPAELVNDPVSNPADDPVEDPVSDIILTVSSFYTAKPGMAQSCLQLLLYFLVLFVVIQSYTKTVFCVICCLITECEIYTIVF